MQLEETSVVNDDEALGIQWMFQYNPRWYHLEASIKRRLIEDWTMFRHRDYVRVGQRIYFMRSGGENAAITAVGRTASLIYEKPEEMERTLRYWVDVVYDELVIPPFTRPEMRADPGLKDYQPYVTGQFFSAFRLPPEVALRTEQVLRGRTQPIGPSTVAVDKRIFVSHSHKDGEFCLQLVHDLRKILGGHDETVWLDQAGGLQGGAAWWREICDNIQERPVFIVVVSPDSMQSNWVRDEIELAWQFKNNAPGGKTIVPVIYRPATMHNFLALRQAISFVSPRRYEEAFRELLTALNLAAVSPS